MATLQQLEQALISADAAGDTQAATILAQEIVKMRQSSAPVTPPAAQTSAPVATPSADKPTGRGFLGTVRDIGSGIVESITGRERATESTRTLPEWTTMPELNSLSVASALAGLGTSLSSPEQATQIIKAQYPDTMVMQDEKGNFILRSSIDGRDYAIPPGFSMGDIPRALGVAGLFTPAGQAKTVLGAGGRAAATQAGIEAVKVGTGATFDPVASAKEIALAGGLEAVVPGSSRVIQTIRGAPATPITRIDPTLDGRPATIDGAQTSGLSMDELARVARTAAGDTFIPGAQARARTVLASETAPNVKTLEAAKRLGIDQYLQPDHITTNQVYRELAQAVKSVPGSQARSAELEGFNLIGDRADKLIADLGGTKDLSTLSANVQKQMQTNVDDLSKKTDNLFTNVINKAIPVRTEINPQNILSYLSARAEDLGGVQNLSAMEKNVLNRLSPQTRKVNGVDVEVFPTYAQLDQVRKDIGSAYKQTGPFKDTDRGSLDQLYGPLAQDQKAVAQNFGVGEAFEAANKSVQIRKAIETDMASLFGKQLHLSMVDNISGAMRALPKADEKKLVNLLRAVPPDMRQEVVASGLNTAFGRAALDKKLGFNEYATWYQGLLQNKQAYAALMLNLPPGGAKQLSDLYRVSRGIALSSRERIVTGRIQAAQQVLFDNADNMVGKIVEAGQKGAIVATIEAAGRTVGLPGLGIATAVASAVSKNKTPMQKAADDLLSSREFLQASRDVAQGSNQKAAEQVAKSKAFARFAKEMNMPREMDYRVQWLLSTMQSSRELTPEIDLVVEPTIDSQGR